MNHRDNRSDNKAHIETCLCNRREFLQKAGSGFGLLGLAGLLSQQGVFAGTSSDGINPLAPKPSHYPATAKSVIWIFLYGGPSGFDLFDYKPELQKNDGKRLDYKLETFNPNPGPLMKSPYSFKQYGECGAWVSEIHPALAECVDDIAFIKSVYCKSNNHAPAMFEMNSGMIQVGYPSTGSWLTYGLGSENQDLPGFIVMYDHRGGPIGGPQNWGSGFLPAAYQGTPVRSTGTPILNLQRPDGHTQEMQRNQLDLMKQLNEFHREQYPHEADLLARIESYELAYRMQMEAPEAFDISGESEETRQLYGLDQDITKYVGTQLLMARRLVERGVRFIQVYSGGGHQQESWDAHYGLKENHDLHCAETDVPIRGLLKDLKQRGLLDSTLIVWGGEFGRLPLSEGGIGRDHNPFGFLMWMAGGGVKGGTSYGETDEIGLKAEVNPVSVHDIHATILHTMGIDHEQLTYFHNGRNFRLTDVHGRVIKEILV
ncbi:MAG: DUF1501 domain-containing protein [bacterium]|jgi:hypothetical protein